MSVERTPEDALFHWRKHYCGLWTGILAGSNGLKLKCLIMYLFLRETQHFTSHAVNWWTGLEWCGLLWCFYQLFGLSFWRHPFTAEDPLVSKWCNAQFPQFSSDEETNSWMAWGRVSTFSANFQFWVNYSLCHSSVLYALTVFHKIMV